jgi:hypothetical protein
MYPTKKTSFSKTHIPHIYGTHILKNNATHLLKLFKHKILKQQNKNLRVTLHVLTLQSYPHSGVKNSIILMQVMTNNQLTGRTI